LLNGNGRGRDRFLDRAQPNVLFDLQREIGRLAHQKQELLFGDGHQLHIGDRDRGGAARLIVDQRHLTENIVGVKVGQRAVAELDANIAALDHEQLVGVLALAKDDAAGFDESRLDIVAGEKSKAGVVLHSADLL
jgi:3-deoxy-D-arabino-heptulosonate 7-phosphate (DAHP) synthase class II